jgi:hypothetical protein
VAVDRAIPMTEPVFIYGSLRLRWVQRCNGQFKVLGFSSQGQHSHGAAKRR